MKKKIIISLLILLLIFVCYRAYIAYIYCDQLGIFKYRATLISQITVTQESIDYFEEMKRFENLPLFIKLFSPKTVISEYTGNNIKPLPLTNKTENNYTYEPPDGWSLSNSLIPEETNKEEDDDRDFWVADKVELFPKPSEIKKNELTGEEYIYDEKGSSIAKENGKFLQPIYFYELLPKNNELLDSEKNSYLISKIDKLIPKNFDEYRTKLIPYIKEMISSKKQKFTPLLEDKLNFPKAPYYQKSLSYTVLYWYLLSKVFEKQKEDNNALLLSQGIFYIAKDYETNYSNTWNQLSKYCYLFAIENACKSILYWSSRPKPESIEIAKIVSNDILDLVENDYPLSNLIEDNKYMFRKRFIELSEKGYSICKWMNKSKYLDEFINNTFNKASEVIDKPFPESIKLLENYDKVLNNYIDSKIEQLPLIELIKSRKIDERIFNYFIFFIEPEKSFSLLLYLEKKEFFLNCKNLVVLNETQKARMELTAIALTINAFYCENHKYPESIEELSKWFGRELPKNRFTNEPYKLDIEGKHLLYNNGVDGKADLSSPYTDDLYFDFSL